MKHRYLFLLGALGLLASGCNPPPEEPETTPQYRSIEGRDALTDPTSSERGSFMITEINWAGSVTDAGVWDPHDVFIELQNRSARPVNLSNWRLIVRGDYIRTYRLPTTNQVVYPNDFFVIAAKRDGAFGDIANVVLEDLRLGHNYIHIEVRDADRRLQEAVGSTGQRVFSGGYDTYATRSMERVQLIFGNQSDASRSWHAYSEVVTHPFVREGWRERTLASPGIANSADYSGSSFGGNLD